MFDLRRRQFLTLLGGAAAWPLAARAQQAMPVIGFLNGTVAVTYTKFVAAFHAGLEETGYVEGRNVAIEFRWADNHIDRLPALAAELVQRRVSVLVATGGNLSPLTAKRATATIPIVFIAGDDAIKIGLVTSINRPEGNLTGVNIFAQELAAKRLELLREIAPRAEKIGYLINPNNPSESELQELTEAVRKFGLELVVANTETAGEIDAAVKSFVQQQAGALLVQSNPFFNSRQEQLIVLAARHLLPTIYGRREFAVAGGLISYGPSLAEAYRQVGVYTGKILKGAKPADLPVIQPTKFELVVNLNTAKALGIDVPTAILLRADEVIE
jgi:putative ABC transport system substrate-binding protein